MAGFLGNFDIALNDNSTALSGGTLTFYEAGTSTPKDTYPTLADALAATNANPNPITLDSDGRPSNGGSVIDIFLTDDTAYKIVIKDSSGTTINDPDNVRPSFHPDTAAYPSKDIKFDDNDGIQDSNGNEVIDVVKAASAVNFIQASNAATGSAPTLTAGGSDTNIGLTFTPKGTGNITLGTWVFDGDETIGASQDNYVVTYDHSSGLLGLEAAAGGSIPNKEITFTAGGFEFNSSASPSLEMLSGATVNTMVLAFDDTTTEFAYGKFLVPADLDTSGTVTLSAYVMPKTAAASKFIQLGIQHTATANGEDFDGALTAKTTGDVAANATQDQVQLVEWTETVSNLGWAAKDLMFFRFYRTTPTGTSLSGDLYLFQLTISIPRA